MRKAADFDKTCSHDQLLRIAAPIIAPVVTRLINFSFSSGSFPSSWKTAKVSPLSKNGDSRDVQNLRPRSVLYLSFLKLSRDTCAIPFQISNGKQSDLSSPVWFLKESQYSFPSYTDL